MIKREVLDRRLADAIAGRCEELTALPDALRALPEALRAGDYRVSATVVGCRLAEVLPSPAATPSLGVAVDIGTSTVVAYLVAPPYPVASPDRFRFTVDEQAAEAAGAQVLFSSAIELAPGEYETLGTSRSVAVVAKAGSLDAARAKVAAAIDSAISGGLEWRGDIGVFPTPVTAP